MTEAGPNFRLAVYGASNAAGMPGYTITDYNISEIVDTAYRKPKFVSETSDEIVIDLSGHPKLEEGTFATNCSVPGSTAQELLEDFKLYVLGKEPTHVFIWSGLNDMGSVTTALDRVSDSIFGSIKGMVDLARENRIIPILGTIPPYAAPLAESENDPQYPEAKHLLSEGMTLIRMVNDRIRALSPETPIIDAYQALVNPNTGLTRVEFCYGDWLHLNTFGQISVVTFLCTELLGKPVRIIPPQKVKV